MSIKRNVLAIGAIITVAGGLIAVGPTPARAATPECDSQSVEDPVCISIFSRELGTYGDPNVVEAVLDGVAAVGQPVILAPADRSDTAQDFKPVGGTVADFYAVDMLSADVNSHYGHLPAAQIEYAPNGNRTGLCAGVAVVAFQNEGLTLVPCDVPGRSVWILDFDASPETAPAWFPIVSGSTTDFSHPFAMTYPQDQYANPARIQQIIVRRLQFVSDEQTLRDTQLWGAHVGVLP
jgi:hypothetical protein